MLGGFALAQRNPHAYQPHAKQSQSSRFGHSVEVDAANGLLDRYCAIIVAKSTTGRCIFSNPLRRIIERAERQIVERNRSCEEQVTGCGVREGRGRV